LNGTKKRTLSTQENEEKSKRPNSNDGPSLFSVLPSDNGNHRNDTATTTGAAAAAAALPSLINSSTMDQQAIVTTAGGFQQQHLMNLLSAWSGGDTTTASRNNNNELLNSVAPNSSLERQMLISALTAASDRNNELQRLLSSNGLRMPSTPAWTSPTQHIADQQLLNLLQIQGLNRSWNQQQGNNRLLSVSETALSSLVASRLLSQPPLPPPQGNPFGTARPSHTSSNNQNDILIQELLLAQARANNTGNMAGSSTSNMPMSQSPAFPWSRENTRDPMLSSASPLSSYPPTSNLEATLSRFLSAQNQDTAIPSQRYDQSASRNGGDTLRNDVTASLLVQQRQLQDRSTLLRSLDRTTTALPQLDSNALLAMLTSENDRVHLSNNDLSSNIQQLQRLLHQQQQDHQNVASLNAEPPVRNPLPRNRLDRSIAGRTTALKTFPMESDQDVEHLSKYQVLIRCQLEFFVSQEDDVTYSVQGRKKQIHIGEVGIRCRHCSHLPHRLRGRGAGYYPAKLSGVYQAAQNMATNHLNQFCNCIPAEIRDELCSLRGGRHDSATGGGKQYWANKCVEIGLEEIEDEGVYFR
jgi:hypothetical protein